MTVSSDTLLEYLPPFNNNSVLIEKNQEVHDIVREVIEAHKYFGQDYDFIYQFFDTGSIKDVCKSLFDFCKQNVDYKIESETKQTTKSPAAIVATGEGDCKHYAGFIAGVLSAIVRNTDRKIDWRYRFACYSILDEDVQHVFVVVNDNGAEIWIDPVLCCFNSKSPFPVSTIDKKVNNKLMLHRLSGMFDSPLSRSRLLINFNDPYLMDNAETLVIDIPDTDLEKGAYEIDPVLEDNIKMLLYYGIIDSDMNISNDIFLNKMEVLPAPDADALGIAYGNFVYEVSTKQTVGNIFSDIAGVFVQINMAPCRAAYLSLVSLNAFNMAGHLYKVITNKDGSNDEVSINKLNDLWSKKLRGDINILLRAIRNGAKKKAILGAAIGSPVLAYMAAATAIIVAITPIISAILKKKNEFDPLTDEQIKRQQEQVVGSNFDLKKYLPFILIGGVGLYLYFDKKKK